MYIIILKSEEKVSETCFDSFMPTDTGLKTDTQIDIMYNL